MAGHLYDFQDLPSGKTWLAGKSPYKSRFYREKLFCMVLRGTEKQFMIEGSLEVKLPTIWTDEKHSRAEAERRERLEERRVEEKESEERRCRCAKR